MRDMLASDPQKRFSQLEPAGTAANEAHIAAKATTFWHDSCTAPIGRVVDQDLRVMGLQGLRVADASVCPRISNAPPSPMAHVVGIIGASIILRGEKAELLKADT